MYRLEELFPDQLQERLEKHPVLVLPLGTVEWHSYHLPLGLDGIVARGICAETARRCEAVLAPVSYWAVGGVPYPYTLNLSIELVEPLYTAIFEQFGAMGFHVIVAFSGHFGLEQTLVVKRAALEVMKRSPVIILPMMEYDMVTDTYTGDHAGTGETSLLMALRPDLARMDHVSVDEALDGVLGEDPRGKASEAQGKELLEKIVARTAEVALRLLKDTTPVQRQDFIEAIRVGVLVQEKLVQQRKVLPKGEVPPLSTPMYVAYCQAIYAGDYRRAKALAEWKLARLAE